MDGPGVYYTSEVRQRKTNTVNFHLYVESKKWNKQIKKQKQIHKYIEQN